MKPNLDELILVCLECRFINTLIDLGCSKLEEKTKHIVKEFSVTSREWTYEHTDFACSFM